MHHGGTCLVTSCCVRSGCMSFPMKALAAAALGLHWSDTVAMLHEVMSWLRHCYITVMLRLLLQLLHQPAERPCYSCCASQERINVSAVPMASESFSSLWASALPTLSLGTSADNVNRKTAGSVNRRKSKRDTKETPVPSQFQVYEFYFMKAIKRYKSILFIKKINMSNSWKQILMICADTQFNTVFIFLYVKKTSIYHWYIC